MAVQPKRGGLNGIAAGIIGGGHRAGRRRACNSPACSARLGSGSGFRVDGVNSEIASLKTEIAGLKETSGNTDASAKVDGLSAALDQVRRHRGAEIDGRVRWNGRHCRACRTG